MRDQSLIRNFAIIAHIDHGKSTLADRLLEMTGTIPPRSMRNQFLDNMELERERGITIKLKTVRMNYPFQGKNYLLNLIDTPGHVDFSYEVSRSLAACEGALLIVDASQGVQAQTLSNFYQALDQGLELVPVINKIDLPNAQVEKVSEDLVQNLGFKKEEIILISAKEGKGIDRVLEAIIKRIPAPKGKRESSFKALIFDSSYDIHKGVLAYVRVIDGSIDKDLNIHLLGSRAQAEVLELGVFNPEMNPVDSLSTGEVGYLATGLKEVSLCQVGDTISTIKDAKPLAGYKKIKPMVFLGLFPIDTDDFLSLKNALEKLKLNDASLAYQPESSPALGNGFRCGFLGLLHAEIVRERLEREYELNLISSIPTVEHQVFQKEKKEPLSVKTPAEFPDPSTIQQVKEPIMKMEVFSPEQYVGSIMQLCESKRAEFKNLEYIGQKTHFTYEIPLSELIVDFYDKLKSISSGYASLDYEFLEFRSVEVAKLDILVAGEKVDALAQIVVKDQAYQIGRVVVKKLKEVIPRQQFKVPIQAAIGGKIIARETLAAYRKDVTAKLYGGDYTRKMKLLQKQKKGKKKMKQVGRVTLPQEAFLAVLER